MRVPRYPGRSTCGNMSCDLCFTNTGDLQRRAEVPMSVRTYLNVPFSEKDAAKRAGARWDATQKKWYAPNAGVTVACRKWLTKAAPKPVVKSAPRVQQPSIPLPMSEHDYGKVRVVRPAQPSATPVEPEFAVPQQSYDISFLFETMEVVTVKELRAH